MDSSGSMTLSVKGGNRLKKNYVGKHFKNYDSFLVLSHFKGHTMAGFGGAIKNISIMVNRMLFWRLWQRQGNRYLIV